MKSIFISITCYVSIPLTVLCQTDVEEPWTIECGISKQTVFTDFVGFNLRCISPKFQLTTEDDYWTEEEQKDPKKSKKIRFLIELLYAPPFKVCTGTCTNFVKIQTPGRIPLIPGTVPIYYVKSITELKEYALSINLQYIILQNKRLSMQITGGLKFFALTSPEYGLVNFQKFYYWNTGVLSQLNLGWVLPFIDIGTDGIYTIGAEFKFKSITKRVKKRYRLHLRKKNNPI